MVANSQTKAVHQSYKMNIFSAQLPDSQRQEGITNGLEHEGGDTAGRWQNMGVVQPVKVEKLTSGSRQQDSVKPNEH